MLGFVFYAAFAFVEFYAYANGWVIPGWVWLVWGFISALNAIVSLVKDLK